MSSKEHQYHYTRTLFTKENKQVIYEVVCGLTNKVLGKFSIPLVFNVEKIESFQKEELGSRAELPN